MMNKIRKYIALIFAALLFVSCSNLVEAVNEPDEPVQKKVVSSVKGECYVSFNLEEPTTEPSTARTVLPDYNYDNCLFKLFGTRGDDSELLLLNKVSYNDLIKARNVSVKSGTWTFTVECFDSNDQKILSGTSIPVNITSGASTIQIPMTFITGTAGSIEVSLSFPSGTDIATVASVKAGLYNSPLAAAGDSCVSLDIANNGETSSVVYEASNLESGLTKYVKFFIYSEAGVELGHYTEAVIIGDNLTSRKELSLSTLRSANVLTLTLKTNGSTYTGEEKTNLVLKTFPNEEFSYPMAKQGSKDTYSAKIVNGTKYILYDGEYNTKLIFIPTASESSDGIVEYCDSLTDAANALTNDAVTKSGLGLMVKDNISTSLGDNYDTAGETLFYNAARVRDKDWISLNLEECIAIESMYWYSICRYPKMISISYPKNNKSAPYVNTSWGNYCLIALYINEGVESYNNNLSPASSLEYLYLPSTLKSINCSGLGNCIKLKNIVISDANEKYSSDGERIMTKDGKTLLSWPSVIGAVELPEGITSIDSGAFCNNTRITDISLPSTLEKIGDLVFSGCSTLRNVNIPEGVTSIGNRAFSSCSNLKSMEIPKGATSIGSSAFSGCSNIKSITIPEGVTNIGISCFSNCRSLESVEIPSTIKNLTQIENLEFAESGYGVFYGCTSLKKVILHSGLEEIGAYTFCGCSQLKTIEFPSTLKKISDYAFSSCALTSLNIPDNVEYLGNEVFVNCNQLKTVSIGSGVNSMGINPFVRCPAITSLSVSSANTDYLSEDNCIYTKDKKKLIYWNLNNKTDVKLEEGLEEIGDLCFYQMENLTSIELPSTLLKIGNSTFGNCKKISEISIPDSVTEIGNSAFYQCSLLKDVKMSSKLTSLGSGAFNYCSSLESITLPYGLTAIGGRAFSGTQIKELIIPGTVSSIEGYAFEAGYLEKIVFNEGITRINGTFCTPYSLKEVYLPKSLTSITYYAFYNSSKLTDVYYAGSSTDWSKISIGSDNNYLKKASRHYNVVY